MSLNVLNAALRTRRRRCPPADFLWDISLHHHQKIKVPRVQAADRRTARHVHRIKNAGFKGSMGQEKTLNFEHGTLN